jgi:hypothetical protein
MDPLQCLSQELWHCILLRLEPTTLLVSRAVSKAWCSSIDDALPWKRICLGRYDTAWSTEDVRVMGEWLCRKYPLKKEAYFFVRSDLIEFLGNWLSPRELYLILRKGSLVLLLNRMMYVCHLSHY